MLNVIDREINFVTWLRYTAWIPLYPTGFVLEGNNLLLTFVDSIKTVCCNLR